MAATIHDVAKASGTSIATVSRVFNNVSGVKKRTAESVLEVARQMDYSPSFFGRVLRGSKTSTIGIVYSEETAKDRSFCEAIITNLTTFIAMENYGVTLELLTTGKLNNNHVFQLIREKRIDGLIFVGYFSEEFLESVSDIEVPICVLESEQTHKNVIVVSVDHAAGAREGVQYLAALNRRKIGYVHGTGKYQATKQRYLGYMSAIKELGLDFDDSYVYQANESQQNYAGGYLGTKELITRNPDLNAIFYANDWYAIGGMAALSEMGKRIPDDISVLGYDNSWMSKETYPSLTTVDEMADDICHLAVSNLVRKIEGKVLLETDLKVVPRIIKRESCAPLIVS